MKNNESMMERLDAYFSKKSESEKWVIILGLSGAIAYILYLYLFPYAENRYKASLNKKKHLEKKVREEQTYLRSITVNGDRNFYVKKFDQDILERKKTIESYKKKIALLNRSFQRLSSVLFNQNNWSKFLDSIAQRAAKNDVQLLEIDNRYVTQKGNFGHVLEIGVRCEGPFQGILSFINDLEQNKLVTDVYQSEIRLTPEHDKLVADLNISVWGVNR